MKIRNKVKCILSIQKNDQCSEVEGILKIVFNKMSLKCLQNCLQKLCWCFLSKELEGRDGW